MAVQFGKKASWLILQPVRFYWNSGILLRLAPRHFAEATGKDTGRSLGFGMRHRSVGEES